jgi:hypothetical protein
LDLTVRKIGAPTPVVAGRGGMTLHGMKLIPIVPAGTYLSYSYSSSSSASSTFSSSSSSLRLHTTSFLRLLSTRVLQIRSLTAV